MVLLSVLRTFVMKVYPDEYRAAADVTYFRMNGNSQGLWSVISEKIHRFRELSEHNISNEIISNIIGFNQSEEKDALLRSCFKLESTIHFPSFIKYSFRTEPYAIMPWSMLQDRQICKVWLFVMMNPHNYEKIWDLTPEKFKGDSEFLFFKNLYWDMRIDTLRQAHHRHRGG